MPKRHLSRHQERLLAFQVLYGLSFAKRFDQETLIEAFTRNPEDPSGDKLLQAQEPLEPSGFAFELVEGVSAHIKQLDGMIERYCQNWRLNRIGLIELTLLRMAFFELFLRNDTPPKVVITEVLELAAKYGEAQAKKFLNGILDAAVKHKPEKDA